VFGQAVILSSPSKPCSPGGAWGERGCFSGPWPRARGQQRLPAAAWLSQPTLFRSQSSSKRCQCYKHGKAASPAPLTAVPKPKAFSLLGTRGGSCPPAP